MSLFGTDGIRGVANRDLTPELAFRVGRAAASVLSEDRPDEAPVIVGRDTRISGSMLEAAIVAGITSVGRGTVSLGIVPSPAVACVTRVTESAAGVVISASHNPVPDNGIKFFGSDGFKLSDAIEDRIEATLDSPDLPRPTGTAVGIARIAHNLVREYYRELSQDGPDLHGLRVVVDAGFGAAYAIAPYVLRKLGAIVSEINCENDGTRINVECGATNLAGLAAAVRGANEKGERTVGVAFDGDADRALFIDELGGIVSGDHILYAIGRAMQVRGQLCSDTIVATVMSNIGFERALSKHGIKLLRTAVGDRYVLERMRAGGFTLGGEQSGHIVDFRYNTTGDGPRAAVTLLGIMAGQGASLRELVAEVKTAPQVLLNVRTSRSEVLTLPEVREEIASVEATLGESGRLLIRASGTEPLIRVMAEGEDRGLIEQLAGRVAARIEREVERLGSP